MYYTKVSKCFNDDLVTAHHGIIPTNTTIDLKRLTEEEKEESGGIGTPATRSSVIKDIFRDRYVELKGKEIVPTELGLKVYEYIADEVKTANVKAEWWLIQREIEEGASVSKLVRKVEKDFLDVMSKSYEKLEHGERVKETIGVCPKCQGDITESKKAYNCSCGFIFWKNEAISLKRFQELIKGKTFSVKGLKSKAGKSYNAKIKLKANYEGFEIVEFLKS